MGTAVLFLLGFILTFLRRLGLWLLILGMAALAAYLFLTGNFGKMIEMIHTEGYGKTLVWLFGLFHQAAA